VLLQSLKNYRIVASLGLEQLSLVPLGVVVDTGAGPFLVRRKALPPEWLRQGITSKEEQQVRRGNSNNARLRTSCIVTLWLQTGARIVPVTFIVVEGVLVPETLGGTFIYDNAHAVLPWDRSILQTDASVTAILLGRLDVGRPSMGVSCAVRSFRTTRRPPSMATVVWVGTMWEALGRSAPRACS